ncbi:hypothetical protein [Hirschia maritima]|uniref:hypothetical protein n=1 Tax=Hirschia maritima TaxID=1121961 RepID=UPI0003614D85|nr:hypothetical protein [Hirschia maritima]
MAKASFHKNQKVFVKPVGTWAIVEKVIPQWVKGLDEPLKIHYDVGLGREFAATELAADKTDAPTDSIGDLESWRVIREKNRWKESEQATDHPHPGTFPKVVTDEKDWGGWRVPSAEYDRDPLKIEFQARIISASPQLMKLAKVLSRCVAQDPDDLPNDIVQLAKQGTSLLRSIYDTPNSGSELNKAAE